MFRILIHYIIPLLAPLALYALWIRNAQRKNPENPMAFFEGPWYWAVLAGMVLFAGSLFFLALSRGADPGTTYHPPRYEDGRVVPGGYD